MFTMNGGRFSRSSYLCLSPILLSMCSTDVWRSRRRRNSFLQFVAIFLACVTGVHSQEVSQGGKPASVRVHGQANLSVEPEQAQFDIGVVTQAATAKTAADQNTIQSDALVRQLAAAFPSASIKGINFSVNPSYQYPRDAAPAIAGYTASNTVRLILDDIPKLQTVIDIAIRSGANSINRLTFSLHNENSVRAKALAEAAHQARAAAEALAAALNLKLGRLLTVEEGQPVIVSPPRDFSFENLQSTTLAPVAAGAIDVHADVELTYELAPVADRSGANTPSAARPPAQAKRP
jgi:uncharacterized protein YggE